MNIYESRHAHVTILTPLVPRSSMKHLYTPLCIGHLPWNTAWGFTLVPWQKWHSEGTRRVSDWRFRVSLSINIWCSGTYNGLYVTSFMSLQVLHRNMTEHFGWIRDGGNGAIRVTSPISSVSAFSLISATQICSTNVTVIYIFFLSFFFLLVDLHCRACH